MTKKEFIFKEYVEERDYTSVYDLVMELLDNSYCEEDDIKGMVEICEYCFSDDYDNIENDVTESRNDWVENNYTNIN